ncbi:hypothetical protein ACH5RR_008125 [Cinchona calisaya]|uniref:AAA+ ATPase domain-containing protein n=1 Tax=Cinchona calisaya TaxID=153742 RepID=A0ABD3ACC8_9GENT
MEIVSLVYTTITSLWDFTCKHADDVRKLQANLKALENALEQLRDAREDVKRRVEVAEEQQMMRRKQVDSWLQRVDGVEMGLIEILENGNREVQKKCNCGVCHQNLWLSYKLGKKVKRKLKEVYELKNEGHFDVVADTLPHGPVYERPMEETIGLSSLFDKLWECINDEQVKIIGIFGMGGVGKTTLLKRINNEFLKERNGFDLVVWVTVSKQSNVEKVQEVICQRLKLPENLWKSRNEDEKAVEIFRVLQKKKFVLLLDDIWKPIDLLKLGVPSMKNQNTSRSKIVFTTRYENVCSYMEADKKFKVECLAREEALALFQNKVGSSTLNSHPDIPRFVEIMAKECKGLPLALIAVSRAMAGKTDPRDWERAVENFKKNPSNFSGIDEDVFHVLKFSYDSLHDDVTKSCFLYCCIFPEDYDILSVDLVELWIGEGFLDDFDDVYEARNQGHEIIRCLKVASLLEGGKSQEHVKMHDVIRDMVLWISSGFSSKKKKVLVLENDGLIEMNRTNCERISLWNCSQEDVPEKPSCPSLVTLLVRQTKILRFPIGFFQNMAVIRVLDLSSNFRLSELPSGTENLVNLQCLNLSHTRIKELPVDLKNLQRLRYLLLSSTYQMELIPREVLLSFSLLQVFSISGNRPSKGTSESNVLSNGRIALLEELECLECLNDISITIDDFPSMQKLLSSYKLQECLSYLCLERCEGLVSLTFSTSSLRRMRHLERLDVYYCQLENVKIYQESQSFPQTGFLRSGSFGSLRKVYVAYCDMLSDLTFLVYAPSLEFLDVSHCMSIQEIISDRHCTEIALTEENLSAFSRLVTIRLINLPSLRSIFPRALPFLSLREVQVGSCYSLNRLPFDANSARNSLKEIRGSALWWFLLRWHDKSLFQSYFVEDGLIW